MKAVLVVLGTLVALTACKNGTNVMQPTPATHLTFSTQPSNTNVSSMMAPVRVTALDASGNTATSFTGNVVVAIGSNPSAGTLSGSKTVSAVNGVATFSDLSINQPGTGYTVTASSSGLTGETSDPFNITVSGSSSVGPYVRNLSVAWGDFNCDPGVTNNICPGSFTLQTWDGATDQPLNNQDVWILAPNPSQTGPYNSTLYSPKDGLSWLVNVPIYILAQNVPSGTTLNFCPSTTLNGACAAITRP